MSFVYIGGKLPFEQNAHFIGYFGIYCGLEFILLRSFKFYRFLKIFKKFFCALNAISSNFRRVLMV